MKSFNASYGMANDTSLMNGTKPSFARTPMSSGSLDESCPSYMESLLFDDVIKGRGGNMSTTCRTTIHP